MCVLCAPVSLYSHLYIVYRASLQSFYTGRIIYIDKLKSESKPQIQKGKENFGLWAVSKTFGLPWAWQQEAL